ncbi:unnamed protein product [Staurois parvus]|uniref:Uncharacterized protein n=1 Tax=Staurois parvus TaxID=386267 RepID=A0ABN9DEL3_9NEOB|nr:unnamed protein product [Staurois parvus]
MKIRISPSRQKVYLQSSSKCICRMSFMKQIDTMFQPLYVVNVTELSEIGYF